MAGYNACKYSPSNEHDFSDFNEDNRCSWCDAKPWYRSVQADYVEGTPVDPTESFISFAIFAAAHPEASRA